MAERMKPLGDSQLFMERLVFTHIKEFSAQNHRKRNIGT